jgi:hypothetical protein
LRRDAAGTQITEPESGCEKRMLTNEEALRLIKECEECFVVWATDQNAIVAVHPIPKEEDPTKRVITNVEAISAMKTDYEGPTKGRFFLNPRDVTLQTLLDEQAETDRVAKRVAIFNSWKNCGIDELIDILIERRIHKPMDVFHGSSYIVDRLYKIHGPQLTERHLARLEQFAQANNLDSEQEQAQEKLQCFLTVLQNDPERLKAFWERHHNLNVGWPWGAFTDAAGDLPTHDQDIISHFINVVESAIMFGPRREAMVALGKIGPPAGLRAVEVIEKSIYDSSDDVTAIRNRVVAHIQQPASNWIQCPHCYHGYVEGISHNVPHALACAKCLGLGRLPKADSLS